MKLAGSAPATSALTRSGSLRQLASTSVMRIPCCAGRCSSQSLSTSSRHAKPQSRPIPFASAGHYHHSTVVSVEPSGNRTSWRGRAPWGRAPQWTTPCAPLPSTAGPGGARVAAALASLFPIEHYRATLTKKMIITTSPMTVSMCLPPLCADARWSFSSPCRHGVRASKRCLPRPGTP
jgi:hypothetical protein